MALHQHKTIEQGAALVDARQACRAPGPTRRGQLHTTGGKKTRHKRKHYVEMQSNTHPIKILQWNAEGTLNKKVVFVNKMLDEKIDVACIQETHLNQNLRFTIRGYQIFRADRVNRKKGGILIMVRNNIPAIELETRPTD